MFGLGKTTVLEFRDSNGKYKFDLFGATADKVLAEMVKDENLVIDKKVLTTEKEFKVIKLADPDSDYVYTARLNHIGVTFMLMDTDYVKILKVKM